MPKQVIKRRAAFADIHQDTRGGLPHLFAVKYRKKDGSIGYKPNVSKSLRRVAGPGGYRGNVNQNHVLLLENHDLPVNHPNRHFEILIDLLVEYNGMVVDHTV
jgi:hypothetical protein